MNRIEYHTVELNGVKLHYAEAQGPGPALVLLHGVTDSCLSYLPLMPELAKSCHVFAPDLRGHGQSAHVPGAYRVGDYTGDICAFLKTVVRGPAVLAGASLGGLVAASVAVRAPQNVIGLFLEDPALLPISLPDSRGALFHPILAQLRQMAVRYQQPGASPEDLARELAGMVIPERVPIRVVQLRQADPEVLDPALDGTLREGFVPDHALPRITCPTHLLTADPQFSVLDVPGLQTIVSAIPRCTHTVLAGAPHDIHHERPREYLGELVKFLRTVRQ